MITLYINKFTCSDKERAAEYKKCYDLNVENELFDKIMLIKSPERPSYQQAFQLMKGDSINVLANADIYFDETLQFVNMIDDREFWCLTRWEEVNEKLMFFTERHPGVRQ